MEEITQHTETGDALSTQLMTDKEMVWENNHRKITNQIAAYLDYYGTMPTKSVIAEETGLSRETVRKHLKSFAAEPIEAGETEEFSAMTGRVMGNVLNAAMRGNLKAAKLFLDTTRGLRPKDNDKTQNNYVQINNTVINQQIIQQLKPEQLERIEQFIAKELEEKQD